MDEMDELCSGLLPTVWDSTWRLHSGDTWSSILILRQLASPSLCQGTHRGIIWQGTWRTLRPRLILHAPGASISLHIGLYSGGEPRTRDLRSQIRRSADWSTTAINIKEMKYVNQNLLAYNLRIYITTRLSPLCWSVFPKKSQILCIYFHRNW